MAGPPGARKRGAIDLDIGAARRKPATPGYGVEVPAFKSGTRAKPATSGRASGRAKAVGPRLGKGKGLAAAARLNPDKVRRGMAQIEDRRYSPALKKPYRPAQEDVENPPEGFRRLKGRKKSDPQPTHGRDHVTPVPGIEPSGKRRKIAKLVVGKRRRRKGTRQLY